VPKTHNQTFPKNSTQVDSMTLQLYELFPRTA